MNTSFKACGPTADKVILIVAPNGARKTKKDHPHLPMSVAETVEEAARCAEAGATVIHAHVRDSTGQHSLDITLNQQLYSAIKQQVGDGIVVQLTTEAVGMYQPQQQMDLIKAVQPEAVSLALKELLPNDTDTAEGAAFFQWLNTQGIIAQYILYSAEDVVRYHQLKAQGVIPSSRHHLLFVLGRYSKNQHSQASDLCPFVQAHIDDTPWAVCAFGKSEHLCVSAAMAMGGDVRVGFENNLFDVRGVMVKTNQALVQQVVNTAESMGRECMSASEFRQRFN